jgi:outer membrane protein OmpA-like peptidoglycan-associated protein
MEERRETAAATAARPYEPTPGMGTLAPTQGLDALASYENQPGKLVAPQRFTLDASFVTGSADLTPGSDASLEKLAGVLRAHPTMRIRVEGYTDAMGKAAGNQQLSLARAESAKSTLVAQGIVPARVETVGMGNANPVAPNMTTEGREQNRRVDVLLLEK